MINSFDSSARSDLFADGGFDGFELSGGGGGLEEMKYGTETFGLNTLREANPADGDWQMRALGLTGGIGILMMRVGVMGPWLETRFKAEGELTGERMTGEEETEERLAGKGETGGRSKKPLSAGKKRGLFFISGRFVGNIF